MLRVFPPHHVTSNSGRNKTCGKGVEYYPVALRILPRDYEVIIRGYLEIHSEISASISMRRSASQLIKTRSSHRY